MGRSDAESSVSGGTVLSGGGLELLLLQATNNTTTDKKEIIFFIRGNGGFGENNKSGRNLPTSKLFRRYLINFTIANMLITSAIN